ncbi:MAG: hypothetical protein EHM93_18160 [Bacteroidales bacterium]|nr:MAG: hypothetical protein EHM93_18160 [Bacteroidales bacterium]
MKYYILFGFILSFSSLYSQDIYLNRIGVKTEDIQKFCDTLKEENKYNTISFYGYSTNIQIGKGEYFYVNNDISYLYNKPNYWEAKKIDKLIFSDSVYVIKDFQSIPICIHVSGDGFGGDKYYLCITKTKKLALLKGDDFIPVTKMTLLPNKDYYLTANRFYNLIISKDKNKYFKIPTEHLIWSDDRKSFIYNNCWVNCDSNSLIYRFNLNTWKPEIICKGIIPYSYKGNRTILYFKDTIINSTKKEFVFRLELENKANDLFYQIPDSLTYWSYGDDYILPSSIEEVQIGKANLYKILLFIKRGESSSHYFFYFDKDKKLIEFRKE